MQKIGFTEALDTILSTDSRYDREAYVFLREALDFTNKQRGKRRDQTPDHVTGQELLDGIRQYALKEFGPMVVTVLAYWGVRRCEDFGEMVYNLIKVGIFGKTDTDSINDFKGAYTFAEAFDAPFRPAEVPPDGARGGGEPAIRSPKNERSSDGEVRR